MKALTPAARAYIGVVIVIGAAVLALRLPAISIDRPLLFVTLLVLSCASSAMKVALPLPTSTSTMSVSYAVDFASLLLLGWDQTMLVEIGRAHV